MTRPVPPHNVDLSPLITLYNVASHLTAMPAAAIHSRTFKQDAASYGPRHALIFSNPARGVVLYPVLGVFFVTFRIQKHYDRLISYPRSSTKYLWDS